MKPSCPVPQCASTHVQLRGSYRRRLDGRRVRRFQCQACRKCFSDQTRAITYRLRRLDLFGSLPAILVCSGAERRCALMLKTTPRTIARYLPRVAQEAAEWQERYLAKLGSVETVVFDEMMSHEHTRLKPLSIPIAVCERTQSILAMGVARIPASGLLAAKSVQKYGPRTDESPQARLALLKGLRATVGLQGHIKSDAHKSYGDEIKEAFPKRKHDVFLSRRGCVVGYGELKRVGLDPLFMLNHACAMVRDSIARMKRRTWCTTKIPGRLMHLLNIYMRFHNKFLLPSRKGLAARSRQLPGPV